MKAFITGVLGQDGSYLSDLLLEKGYVVYGMIRRTSGGDFSRVQHIMNHPNFRLVEGDMADQVSLNNLIKDTQPDEVYNLAAQSHVGTSFSQPIFTSDVTGLGVTRMLEAVKASKPDARFYQASSSEMFGKVKQVPQTEDTPLHPRSPYGVAKCYGHWITQNYRESYDMFCCSGILFNHESPRRGLNFVTRKITDAVGQIKAGKIDKIGMGLLTPQRDWGHAKDYVRAMWLMLQQDTPDDYVIATGETHSVQEFCELAFGRAGLDYRDHVYRDPRFVRPAEVDLLIGDATKANNQLQWKPEISFAELVGEMVDADIERHEEGQ